MELDQLGSHDQLRIDQLRHPRLPLIINKMKYFGHEFFRARLTQ